MKIIMMIKENNDKLLFEFQVFVFESLPHF